MPKRIKLEGSKTGMWSIVSYVGMKKRKSMYLCQCDCGTIREVRAEHLLNKRSSSCGCNVGKVASKTHKGRKRSKETCDRISKVTSGKLNHNYNPNLTDEDRKLRNKVEYSEWRIAVYKRDYYTCQCCTNKRCKINAHHIKAHSRFPELRYDVDNGITLCVMCHKEFHSTYGTRTFTSDDFYEYLKMKGVNDVKK